MAPDSTEGWRGPSRGDFLMLPPMKLNAHIPQRLTQHATDYAVTRRTVKVSERTMAHGVDSDFQGMLRISHASSAPARAPKPAQSTPDLESRTRSFAPAADDESSMPAGTPMQSFSTPPASPPRKARATQAAKPPSPLGSTQRSVNRTIGQPQDRQPATRAAQSTSAPQAEAESSELSDTRVSAIMHDVTNSSATPIADQRVRRRDGQSSVISKGSAKAETPKAAPEGSRTQRKALESEAATDVPAMVSAPQQHVTRTGVPVPPELAPAPVAKEEPVAPAEIPLVTRQRSRDSLADPVAVAAARKAAEAAVVAEAEAKAASERAREMTPVQARSLGSSSRGSFAEAPESKPATIVGSIVESTNPPRRETPAAPTGRAEISSPRRTAPSVTPVVPALESATVEPSQSTSEEVELTARTAPVSENTPSSAASESRSASVPTPASQAGVQRRASDTPPVVSPSTTSAAPTPPIAQGSSPSAGITSDSNSSSPSRGVPAQAQGSSASSGIVAQAQGSSPADGTVAQAQGSTVNRSTPASAETVRPKETSEAPEVALTARSTPHVETVAQGSSPSAGVSMPANGSSTPSTPAMSSNSSTPAASIRAEAQGSSPSAGIVAEAQGTSASAGVTAEAQGSTVSTSAPRSTETVRSRDIADAPQVALDARKTPHVDTVAAGSSPAAGVTAPANGSSKPAAPALTSNSSTPSAPTRAEAHGSTVAAASQTAAATSSSSSSPSASAGVQRRASADSGSTSAPASASSDSGSSSESPSTESAQSRSPRESVRATESAESPDVELVSRSARDSSPSTPVASLSAPTHLDPVPAARASSHAVPADVRAAVAATAGSAPQNVSLKRGAHVDAHASAIKADAFTAKGTVHVPGTAPLTSDASRRLLAHELTHVVQQQRHGSRLPAENTPAGRALEAEALRAETLIGMPPARGASVAGIPPFNSGNSSPTGTVPSARTSSPAPGTPAAAQGSSPSPGLVARANGSTAGRGNPAVAQGSTAAAGTPAIARGSSPSVLAPVELAPRRPAPAIATEASSGPDSRTVDYSGGATQPPAAPRVQRRASGGSPVSNTYDADMPDIKEAGKVAKASPPQANQNQNQNQQGPDNTWRDAKWLQQHATALYPLIRGMLRDELLNDRERRGKMMREY